MSVQHACEDRCASSALPQSALPPSVMGVPVRLWARCLSAFLVAFVLSEWHVRACVLALLTVLFLLPVRFALHRLQAWKVQFVFGLELENAWK